MGIHDCLFAEMDQMAATVCDGATLVDDLQIEFRQLQKFHFPDLTKTEWLELFHVWLAHYRARIEAALAARDARIAELWAERSRLLARQETMPRRQFDNELWAIGKRIANLVAPPGANRPPAGASWIPTPD